MLNQEYECQKNRLTSDTLSQFIPEQQNSERTSFVTCHPPRKKTNRRRCSEYCMEESKNSINDFPEWTSPRLRADIQRSFLDESTKKNCFTSRLGALESEFLNSKELQFGNKKGRTKIINDSSIKLNIDNFSRGSNSVTSIRGSNLEIHKQTKSPIVNINKNYLKDFSSNENCSSDLSSLSHETEDSFFLEEQAQEIAQIILKELGEEHRPHENFRLKEKIIEILKRREELTFIDLKRIFGVDDYCADLSSTACFSLLCEHIKIY